MEEEEKSVSNTSLESGYHKWICFDHSHPHLFKDGKCMNCGLVDREQLKPQKLSQTKAGEIAKKLGFKIRDKSKKRGKLPGEIELPPDLKAVFDYAVNYSNKWDMIQKGIYKPTLVELDQMKADKVILRFDNDGNIIKVTPVEEEEEKDKK